MSFNQRILFFLTEIFLLGAVIFYWYSGVKSEVTAKNFIECAEAGNPIMESYPRRCRTSEGVTFSENIGDELLKSELVRLSFPRPNEAIKSPLIIRGEARGFWFFEASFPVKLFDGNGKELAVSIASAKSEWMTEDFVLFEATLSFDKPETEYGALVLEKDNPSGLPEHSDNFVVPIRFTP